MILYQIRREPRSEIVRLRGLDMHVKRWGPMPDATRPPVFLLHGWLDTCDTFQFLVDAFHDEWPVVALDWRGFGRSEWPQDGYWFPDYFADLDALLDLLSPDRPARLIGHSMGGNIACMYAGLRPARVHCVANLEGFGLPRSSPENAPGLIRQWLDQVKTPPQMKDYESLEKLTGVIRFRYPRFSEDKARFVADAWSEFHEGRIRLVGDARHRWASPVRYNRDDAEATWRHITAPLLLILGDDSDYRAKLGAEGTDAGFKKSFPRIEIARIAGAGHMLHIEKPEEVAPLIEEFLRNQP